MPREPRRKPAPDIPLPERNEDAAERKRVLNVLAQRRYRKRKREQFETLENQVKQNKEGVTNTSKTSSPEDGTPPPRAPSPETSMRNLVPWLKPADDAPITNKRNDHSTSPYNVFSGGTGSWERTETPEDPNSVIYTAASSDSAGCTVRGHDTIAMGVLLGQISQNSSNEPLADSSWPEIHGSTDAAQASVDDFPPESVELPTPLSSPATADFSTPDFDLFDPTCTFDSTGNLSAVSFTYPLPIRDHSIGPLEPSAQPFPRISPLFIQSPRTPSPSPFTDNHHIRILELDLLRGCLVIAKRLGVAEALWSLSSNSPFNAPATRDLDYSHLPPNLQPTAVQKSTPHHPLLDLLPWPAARNKLILVFSQPAEFRPPQAQLLDLVYDIEDSAEGVRIWNGDPCDWRNWELGEKVFGKWWWAFDGDAIGRSNWLRRERGAGKLGQGRVVGEVGR